MNSQWTRASTRVAIFVGISAIAIGFIVAPHFIGDATKAESDRDQWLRQNIVGEWTCYDDNHKPVLITTFDANSYSTKIKSVGFTDWLFSKDSNTFIDMIGGPSEWTIEGGVLRNKKGDGVDQRIDMPDRSTMTLTPLAGSALGDPSYDQSQLLPKRFIRTR